MITYLHCKDATESNVRKWTKVPTSWTD